MTGPKILKWVGLLLVSVALSFATLSLAQAQTQPSCDFSNYPQSFTCNLPTAVPATSTATAVRATATLAPVVTATPIPTPVPTDTPTPIPTPAPAVVPTSTSAPVSALAISSIAGVPLCGVAQADGSIVGPAHDATVWHSLVERDATGAVLCTYGHDHGSDPHALDAELGTLNVAGGQEVAFPWMTSVHENDVDPASLSHLPSDSRPVINGKHAFFKWETLTAAKLLAVGITGCPPNSNGKYGFDRIRMQVHADANAGADIRFHSFYVDAQQCSTTDASYHGRVQIGGWFDYGQLQLTHRNPTGVEFDVVVPLPGTDPCVAGSILANKLKCPYVNNRRIHAASGSGPTGSTDPNATLAADFRSDFTWYGHDSSPDLVGTGLVIAVSDGIREEDWGPVDPNNPHGPVLFRTPWGPPGHNHGQGGIDILDVINPNPSGGFLSDDLPTLNPDGTYTWAGFVDNHGVIQPFASCAAALQGNGPTLGCIPAFLTNVRAGEAQFSNDITHVRQENVDVTVGGVSLIAYPN